MSTKSVDNHLRLPYAAHDLFLLLAQFDWRLPYCWLHFLAPYRFLDNDHK
ncbi:hypothetical protein [Ktedonobacter robiniae]|nr:hypothetical protein [Ktedonobacter robiniae]